MASAFPVFDSRSIVLRTISDLRMSIAQFANCQYENRIPRWTLERILNGSRSLDRAEATQLAKFCKELHELQRVFGDDHGISPDWRDHVAVQSTLRRWSEIDQAREK